MIASGTWWKRAEAVLKVGATLPLLAIGGCGVEQILFGRPPAPPAPPPLPAPRPESSRVDVSAGLSPLPSPQQVLTAIPFGRTDPFGTLPGPALPPAAVAQASTPAAAPAATEGSPPAATAAAGTASGSSSPAAAAPAGSPRPAPLQAPQDFRLMGVIRSGGRAEALVSLGGASGSLRIGDRGGRTTGLLPPGWVLGSIQFGGRTPVDPPSITLLRGVQRVRVSL